MPVLKETVNIRSLPEVSLDKSSVLELKRDVLASLKDRVIKSEKFIKQEKV